MDPSKEFKVKLDIKELKEILDHKVSKDQQDTKEQLELKGIKVYKD